MNESAAKFFKRLIIAVIGLLAVVWIIAVLHPQYTQNTPTGALDIWMLDVGQGESVFLHAPTGQTILFDGGPDDSVLNQLGAVMPLWDREINLMILSHNHSDHIAGLIPVLDRYQVDQVWTSGAVYTSNEYHSFHQTLDAHHLVPSIHYFNPATCTKICPTPYYLGPLELQVYHPTQDMTGKDPDDQHDATLSVKVTYDSQSIFLTGDLNEGHETDMIKACPPPNCTLAATILQVPHHGSATGLLPAFLQAVHPEAALIPVGLNNKFKHPRPETLQKLQAASIPIYRTDLQGRIHVVMDGHQIRVSTEKP